MTWRRHFTKRRLLILATVLIFYAGLWFLTYQFGTPQIRTVVVSAMRSTDYHANWSQQTNRFSGRFYWCSTRAYAPFLVYADYGWQGGPLYGDGGSALYLWFFGRSIRIRELEHWAS